MTTVAAPLAARRSSVSRRAFLLGRAFACALLVLAIGCGGKSSDTGGDTAGSTSGASTTASTSAATSSATSTASASSSTTTGTATATTSSSTGAATDSSSSSSGSTTSATTTGWTTGGSTTGGTQPDGTPCGYNNEGTILNVTADIEVCLPPTICNNEVCSDQLGTCTPNDLSGTCEFKPGYNGLKTLPEAWATWYCDLEIGCNGTLESATQQIRDVVQANLQLPTCYEDSSGLCLGITAVSPMLGGNSRLAKDMQGASLARWGLGLTPASGLCYELTGTTGKAAVVAITDRCAGYCACDANMTEFEECGNCLLKVGQSVDAITPGCPCVGTVDALGAGGQTCAGQQTCDWCMTNSHPHFDLDVATFNHLCDTAAAAGSCQLASVSIVPCMTPTKWPCDPGSWFCFGDNPTGQIPGTYCCQ